MVFPLLGNSDHVVVSVSIDFPSYSRRDASFHHIAYDYSHANWDGLHDHLRDVPREDIFKLSVFAAASEFYEWVQVGIYVHIPYRKYQVKCLCCYKSYRNHFFCLCQKEKSFKFKLKFRQASNFYKRVLEAPKLAYANKTSQKLGSQEF